LPAGCAIPRRSRGTACRRSCSWNRSDNSTVPHHSSPPAERHSSMPSVIRVSAIDVRARMAMDPRGPPETGRPRLRRNAERFSLRGTGRHSHSPSLLQAEQFQLVGNPHLDPVPYRCRFGRDELAIRCGMEQSTMRRQRLAMNHQAGCWLSPLNRQWTPIRALY